MTLTNDMCALEREYHEAKGTTYTATNNKLHITEDTISSNVARTEAQASNQPRTESSLRRYQGVRHVSQLAVEDLDL